QEQAFTATKEDGSKMVAKDGTMVRLPPDDVQSVVCNAGPGAGKTVLHGDNGPMAGLDLKLGETVEAFLYIFNSEFISAKDGIANIPIASTEKLDVLAKFRVEPRRYWLDQLKFAANIYCTATELDYRAIRNKVMTKMNRILKDNQLAGPTFVALAKLCYGGFPSSDGPLIELVRDYMDQELNQLNNMRVMDQILDERGMFGKEYLAMLKDRSKRRY
ncbi:hypothetical protein LTS18_012749, partial [Coniosporium uncinatum]